MLKNLIKMNQLQTVIIKQVFVLDFQFCLVFSFFKIVTYIGLGLG